MKLATFRARSSSESSLHSSSQRIGLIIGDEVLDVRAACPSLPTEMRALAAAGEAARETLLRALHSNAPRLPLSTVELEAPIQTPPKFLGIGLNYREHIDASLRRADFRGFDSEEKPSFPKIFNKQTGCLHAPYAPVYRPRKSNSFDYEGELGFVIGRRCREVPAERAREVIFGYVVGNDFTVREWQFQSPTMTAGKSFDTHGPIGPWIVTPDELEDPHCLALRTTVNGELRQESNTAQLIFNCFELVEILSGLFTLEVGDIVLTGTPPGCGVAMKPPRALQIGDVVRVEIDGIGHIENRVIAEPENRMLL